MPGLPIKPMMATLYQMKLCMKFFDWLLVEKQFSIKSRGLSREWLRLAGFWFTEPLCRAIIIPLTHNQYPRNIGG